MTGTQFAAKWRNVQLTERSAAQQHFLDLCDVVGHPKPAEVDKTGESFTFERGTAKHGGGKGGTLRAESRGWADVWKKGFFAEGIGLLPDDLFTHMLRRTAAEPALFARYLGEIIAAMASGGNVLLQKIRHFNGSPFDRAFVLELTEEELRQGMGWPSWTGAPSIPPSSAPSSYAAWTPPCAPSSGPSSRAAPTSRPSSNPWSWLHCGATGLRSVVRSRP